MANNLGTLTLDLVAQIGGFTQQMNRAASATEKSMKQMEAASSKAKIAVNSLFAVVAGGFSVNSLKNAADSFTSLNNRLRLVTSSSEELVKAQEGIFKISQITSQSIGSTTEVYQRFAQNAKELGINQQQVASLTETVAKSIAVSGTSVASAEAALMQFGQALNSGVLRGQEFNSVMEQAPGLAKALATGLKIPVGSLRALANEGKLTTDVLIEALENASDEVNDQFLNIRKTIGNALTNLSNGFIKYIGEADQAAGVSQTLSQAILFLSENLNTVFSAGLLIAGTRLGAFTFALGESAVASFNSRQQTLANAAAKREDALATIQDTQAKIANVQAERSFAIAVQQSLASQLKATQTEIARNAIRQQMKANAAQIVTLTNAETEATVRLAAAQKSVAGVGATIFRAVGGISGLGAVVGVAATAWALFSSKTDEAKTSLDAMPGTIEEVRKKLDEMTVSQAEAFRLGIDNKIKELQKQQQETVRKIGESLTAKTATVDYLTGEIVYNDEILKTVRELNELTESGGDAAEAINQLKSEFGNLIPNDLMDRLTLTAGAVDDLKLEMAKLDQQSKAASDRLKEGAASAKEFGDAVKEAFNPQQVKGLESLQKKLDDQILRIKDKSGKLTLEAQIKAIAPNGAQSEEDKKIIDGLYSSLDKLNKLRASQGGTKSSVTSNNELTSAYKEQVDQLTKQLTLMDDKNEAQRISYELQNGSLSNVTETQRQVLEGLAFEVDLRKEVAEAAKKQAEQQAFINSLNDEVAAKQKNIDLDVVSVGMGSRAFEEYRELIDIQEDYAKKRQQLAKDLGKKDGLTMSDYQERISALQAAQDMEVAIVQDGQKRKREAESSWLNGAIKSYQNYIDDASNVAKQTESLFTSAYSNMENALVSFVRQGKLSFKDFTNAFLDDLAKIGVRMASSAALQAVFGSLGSLIGGSFGASNQLNGLMSNSGLFANGGAFNNGVQAFATGGAFTNSIVNKPTLFPFAKGAGLMGEAGPEAIMPLTRTANGSLGVKMVTDQISQSKSNDKPQVNIVINGDGTGDVQTTQGYEAMGQEMYRQIQQIADDRILYQKQQGGLLNANNRRNQ